MFFVLIFMIVFFHKNNKINVRNADVFLLSQLNYRKVTSMKKSNKSFKEVIGKSK